MNTPRWRSRLHVRLILAIGLPLIVVEGARMLVEYRNDRAQAEQQTRAYLVEVTRQQAEALASRLSTVMQATRSAAWFLGTMHLTADRATMHEVLSGVVEQSPLIYGSAVAFAPESERGAFYVSRTASGMQRIDFADRAVDYRDRDWFQRPLRTNAPSWSPAYYDSGIGNVRMVTYSVPWRDASDTRAVITADIALDTLDIGWTSPWGGATRIVDEHGQYLAHGGDRAPETAGVFAAASTFGLDELEQAGQRMAHGDSGLRYLRDPDDGEGMYWMSYAPIAGTGWSLMALIDEDRVLANTHAQLRHQLLLSLIALLLALLTLTWASKRLTRPLDALRRVAAAVGRGDHSERAGVRRSHDEIGQFAGAFDGMLDALESSQAERLHEVQQRQRIEGELAAARDMQRRLLPPPLREWKQRADDTPDFDFHGVCEPATMMSGDFFDAFALDDDTVALLVADVCGKGAPAALYMVMVRTHLRGFSRPGRSPAQTLSDVNRALVSEHQDGMFATVLLVHYHRRTGHFDYACAGHPPPLLARADAQVERIAARGDLLGAFDNVEYVDAQGALAPGDTLLLCSDGVTEAGEHADSPYGLARLESRLAQGLRQPLDMLCDTILADVLDYTGGEAEDDITLLALRHL